MTSFLSILSFEFKFETRCSNSAASLIQWWIPTMLLFCSCFFDDQVCLNAEYDRMFEGIGLAVLSGLGRRLTHAVKWLHLPFRGHWPCPLRSNNSGCSRTNAGHWQLASYPQRTIPASYRMVLNLAFASVQRDSPIRILLEFCCEFLHNKIKESVQLSS